MEPRKDEKTTEVRKEAKPSRFRIDKLEERIAPTATRKYGYGAVANLCVGLTYGDGG